MNDDAKKKRIAWFEKTMIPPLEGFSLTNPTYGKYTFFAPGYGIIDVFPVSNKLLVRKENKWISGAEKWIIKNVFKETENG